MLPPRKREAMTYILYNPLSNNSHGTEGLDQVLAAAGLRDRDHTPVLVDVTREDEAEVLMGLADTDEAIVCGGDGTLHYLVNALAGRVPAAAVYLWRMGTGNDFLRDVAGRTKEQMVRLNEYLRGLPTAEVIGGSVEKRYFLNNASFGLDGQVCELGEQEKARLGRPVNYISLALRLVVKDFRPARATVTVDGESRTYENVWVASAFNGKYVGGGMKLAPGQDRTSDKLCCVVLHSLGRGTVLFHLAKVYWGGHVKMKQCDVRFGRDISVTFDEPGSLNMDGEPLGRVKGFHALKAPVPSPAACETGAGMVK